MTDSVLHTRFPADFRWSLATAAYQIEGAAHEGGRGPSIWDTFSHTPGLTTTATPATSPATTITGGDDDLDLLASSASRDYRLSVSWSRLQPSGRGPLNPEGVAFYRARARPGCASAASGRS